MARKFIHVKDLLTTSQRSQRVRRFSIVLPTSSVMVQEALKLLKYILVTGGDEMAVVRYSMNAHFAYRVYIASNSYACCYYTLGEMDGK